MQRSVGDYHGDVGGVSYSRSRERDVYLAVGKYRGRQVDRDFLEGLPLGFVDLPPKETEKTSETESFSLGLPLLPHTLHSITQVTPPGVQLAYMLPLYLLLPHPSLFL